MTTSLARVHESDLQLAAAIVKRDRKATARLIELHADAVHRYVWRRLAPKVDLVDDLVQEVFVAAWRGLEKYSGEASLQTWLVSIARNKVEDHYRNTLGARLESLEAEEDAQPVVDSVNLDTLVEQSRQAAWLRGSSWRFRTNTPLHSGGVIGRAVRHGRWQPPPAELRRRWSGYWRGRESASESAG